MINFPSSPTDGQVFVAGTTTYTYSTANTRWQVTPAASNTFQENDQIVTANYTLTNDKNAVSAGPITIADSVTVTVPTGATWTIV